VTSAVLKLLLPPDMLENLETENKSSIGNILQISVTSRNLHASKAAEPELDILPGATTQIKNQELELELSLKFKTAAGAKAI